MAARPGLYAVDAPVFESDVGRRRQITFSNPQGGDGGRSASREHSMEGTGSPYGVVQHPVRAPSASGSSNGGGGVRMGYGMDTWRRARSTRKVGFNDTHEIVPAHTSPPTSLLDVDIRSDLDFHESAASSITLPPSDLLLLSSPPQMAQASPHDIHPQAVHRTAAPPLSAHLLAQAGGPPVPRGGGGQPGMDPRQHPAAQFVSEVLQGARKNPDPSAHVGAGGALPAFFQPEGLDAIAALRNGLYMTLFDADGANERYIRLASGGGGGGYHFGGGVPCLVVSNRPDSENAVDRLALCDLVGVQGGAGNPAFRPHFKKQGFVKGVLVNQRRTLHPTRLCMSLWFRNHSGCRSVDAAAVNDTIYNMVVQAMHALRCINTEGNHVVGSDNAKGSPHDQTHLAQKNDGCVIL